MVNNAIVDLKMLVQCLLLDVSCRLKSASTSLMVSISTFGYAFCVWAFGNVVFVFVDVFAMHRVSASLESLTKNELGAFGFCKLRICSFIAFSSQLWR